MDNLDWAHPYGVRVRPEDNGNNYKNSWLTPGFSVEYNYLAMSGLKLINPEGEIQK